MNPEMCTDCGCRPVWWRAFMSYCRECVEKNGHTYLAYVEVDVDKLAEVLGGTDKVEAFLDKVKSDR